MLDHSSKIVKMQLQMATNDIDKNSGILWITEIWLHPSILKSAIELTDQSVQHQDRNRASGQTNGG